MTASPASRSLHIPFILRPYSKHMEMPRPHDFYPRTRRWRWLLRVPVCLLLSAGLFLAAGYWNATRAPVIVQVRLPLPGLAAGQEIHVLLIGDTQAGHPDMPRERLERIVDQANALAPDLIALVGDYHGGKFIDPGTLRLEDALEPLARLRAPLGVFAVLGNHDTVKWTPFVLDRQGGRPQLLLNAHADVGPLIVAGVNSQVHSPDFTRTFSGIPADRPVLLLLHEPEQLLYRKRRHQVLALAGHTHGGQINLPVLSQIKERLLGKSPCLRGLCALNGWPVYVTSGIGTSWLPIRFNVPPEMVDITLYSGKNSGTDR